MHRKFAPQQARAFRTARAHAEQHGSSALRAGERGLHRDREMTSLSAVQAPWHSRLLLLPMQAEGSAASVALRSVADARMAAR